eukprot:SAG31_NODE_43002_length_269_cov_0.605882_1_plen_28_part_01
MYEKSRTKTTVPVKKPTIRVVRQASAVP